MGNYKMKFLLLILVLISFNMSGQSIHGIWYNEKCNSFIDIRVDSCIITNKFYSKNDTVGYFISRVAFAKSDSTQLILWRYFYTNGIIFWRQKEKNYFKIESLSDSCLVLRLNEKKSNKSSELTDLMCNPFMTYKRISYDDYFKKIGCGKEN